MSTTAGGRTRKAAAAPAAPRRRAPQDRRAPAKAATAPPAVEDADQDLIDLDALPERTPELVPLFRLNGRTYMVEKEPPASVGLRVMQMARTHGQEVAFGWMLEELIGSEGYAALCGCRNLPPGTMQEITQRALKVTVGALEGVTLPLAGA